MNTELILPSAYEDDSKFRYRGLSPLPSARLTALKGFKQGLRAGTNYRLAGD